MAKRRTTRVKKKSFDERCIDCLKKVVKAKVEGKDEAPYMNEALSLIAEYKPKTKR